MHSCVVFGHRTRLPGPHPHEGAISSNSHKGVLWAGKLPSQGPSPLPSDLRYKFHGVGHLRGSQVTGRDQRSDAAEMEVTPCCHAVIPACSEAVPISRAVWQY